MIVSIWAAALEAVKRRPGIFLVAATLLAATNLQMWAMGVLDGAKAADAGAAAVASYLVIKLAIIVTYLLASLRIAGGCESRLLSLSGRQLKWLAGLIGFMILSLAFRAVVTKSAAFLLAPLGADKVMILLAGLAFYFITFMYVQMRLTPALIGVLLGDAPASLRWSWGAMKGRVAAAIAMLVVAVAPLFTLHLGNNLLWVPAGTAARATVLLFDGFVMAALIQVAMTFYALLYRRVREQSGSLAPPSLALA